MSARTTALSALRLLPRGLVRLAIVTVFGTAYGLVVFAWGPQTVAGSTYTFAAAFLLSAAIGLPVHAKVQRRLDALLAIRGTDTQLTLRAFLAEMATATDFAGLVRRALEIVTIDLGIARAALFLVPAGGRDLMLADAHGPLPADDRLAIDDPLVEILGTIHVELDRAALETSPRYAGVDARCLATLDRLGADTLLPIEAQGTLVGVLALGPPAGMHPLGAEELDLLRALTAEFGLCVARARDAERLRSEQLELERIARGLPRAIAHEVLRGRLLAEGGRRRAVSVVTCDVRGLIDLAEHMEAAELQQALERYRTRVTDEIMAQGGTVVEVCGSAVTAVFGDPEPVVDHGRRAIRTGVQLAGPVAALWAPWRRAPTDLPVGVGVATGTATVGFIPAGARLEYQVIGRVKQTAQQLARRAANGEVLVSALTLASAGPDVRTEPVTLVDDTAGSTPVHRVLVDS